MSPIKIVEYLGILGCMFWAFGVLMVPSCFASNHANRDTVRIYIDADRTGAKASGIAIERGIRTALAEVNSKLGGYPVEIITRDHRGNSARSRKHLQEFLADDRAMVVFCGLHSPPVLAHREFINQNHILMLDPWAAAGPITRFPSADNWIFRLSIDDTKAGYVIAEYALRTEGYKRPFLLLEETGWGKSNEETMTEAIRMLGGHPSGVAWFNWNLRRDGAKIMLRNIAASNADVIFMVANSNEGKIFIQAMAELPPELRLPIRSHWGITGGDFSSVIGQEVRQHIDLAFIQTRFSFVSYPDHPVGKRVLRLARKLFPDEIKEGKDIQAPAGFIHAYDLTRLLIAAVEQTGLSGHVAADRRRIRDALEHLEAPVSGLIRIYQRPFSPYSKNNPDAHEALSMEDYVMARYWDHGTIIILESGGGQDGK